MRSTMKSLHCLIRPRRGQASPERGPQSPRRADKENGRKAVDLHGSDKKNQDGDIRKISGGSEAPRFPQTQSAELIKTIGYTQDILSQINTLLAADVPPTEQADHQETSISTSIATHLADLHASAKALHAILGGGKKILPPRVNEASEASREPPVEHPRRLPTPELGDLFDGSSVLDCAVSFYSDKDPEAPFSREVTSQKLPQSPPASSPPFQEVAQSGEVVAPLRLPRRSFSVGKSTKEALDRRPIFSPFEKEMRDIDRQIKESSHLQALGRSQSTTCSRSNINRPPSASLLHRRRINHLGVGTPCRRRVVSLQAPVRGYDSPTVDSFCSSESEADSSPPRDGSVSLDLERQFSTEAKTRRLRSIKRMSAPAVAQQAAQHITLAEENIDPADEEEEPLRMEELMDFLREGNSMRDL